MLFDLSQVKVKVKLKIWLQVKVAWWLTLVDPVITSNHTFWHKGGVYKIRHQLCTRHGTSTGYSKSVIWAVTCPRKQGNISRTKGRRPLNFSENLEKGLKSSYSKHQISSLNNVAYSAQNVPGGWHTGIHPPPRHVRARVNDDVYGRMYRLSAICYWTDYLICNDPGVIYWHEHRKGSLEVMWGHQYQI